MWVALLSNFILILWFDKSANNQLYNGIDVSVVLDQLFDDDNGDNPIVNSEYYDLDQFKLVYDERNMNSNEYGCTHMNIRSLPDKFDKLKLLLANLSEDGMAFDFILICETFLTNVNNTMYNLDGYNYVGSERCEI